jgi:predicted ATP-dependent endonuclease of OLD family
VIIITSVAFLEREFSLFFIEEPEGCLHPGLLRKLALFLLNHTRHQFIATTHSNHLLDLVETHGEVVIHRVSKAKKDDEKAFKIYECTRDQDLLNDLGILPSSVYLANSTIWVEGITDRLYLKAFMRKYVSSLEDDVRQLYEGYLENFHYAFVEYQGGALGHWRFDDQDTTERLSASRVCATALLLADGDIIGKGERAEVLKLELKDRLYILPCKEIENILPLEIIRLASKRIFDRKQSKTTVELDVNNLDRILKKEVETSSFGIGYHLDKCLGLVGKGKSTRRVFADESGTINEKVKFCREALEVMSESDWKLSMPIKTICSIIFAHVLKCN